MNCKKTEDVVYDYLGDRLAGHVRLEFELHVEECERCAHELADTENLLKSMKSLSKQRMHVDCWSEVRERISEPARNGSAGKHWFFRPAFAAPAFAVLAILVLVLMWPFSGSGHPGTDAVSVPEYSRYISAHSHVQSHQAFTDPNVTFVTAELEKASLTTGADRL